MNRPLRVLIVDDEEPARLLLREHLAGLPGVEVLEDAANGFEALKTVAEQAPDVLLLDVRMPKLDGFEVVELLGESPERPAVIFVTAFEEHALRAFRVHAVDYLLKPVDGERLRQALSRVSGRRAAGTADRGAVAREARGGGALDRVVVREGAAIHVLPVETIDVVEARDDYVVFHCGKASHRKQQTLAEVEAQLDPRRFVRLHRSFLARLDAISRIELYAKDSRIALLRDGRKLPISRAGYDRLKDLL